FQKATNNKKQFLRLPASKNSSQKVLKTETQGINTMQVVDTLMSTSLLLKESHGKRCEVPTGEVDDKQQFEKPYRDAMLHESCNFKNQKIVEACHKASPPSYDESHLPEGMPLQDWQCKMKLLLPRLNIQGLSSTEIYSDEDSDTFQFEETTPTEELTGFSSIMFIKNMFAFANPKAKHAKNTDHKFSFPNLETQHMSKPGIQSLNPEIHPTPTKSKANPVREMGAQLGDYATKQVKDSYNENTEAEETLDD
ncbi:hypothetical protein STEG23_001791, partial [Scotinomys teguina]